MRRLNKFLSLFLFFVLLSSNCTAVFAIQEITAKDKPVIYKANATAINYAFVFDGPSDKNNSTMTQFQNSIIKSTAPDYKAIFPKELIFAGNWTPESVKKETNKALNSKATVVVSLGYLSSKYLNDMKDKKKFVVTIDQYGLRDIGDDFFNPVQQSAKGVMIFKRFINFNKTAILMNENYYKTRNDWNSYLSAKLQNVNFVVVPVSKDVDAALKKIPADCDAVVFTPLFNLSIEQRKGLIEALNKKKMYTFSTLGREDVDMGVLLGTGAYDADRKIAEATSFNIQGVLRGEVAKESKVQFYEDEIIYINKDTADLIGYQPHLRIMNNAEIISHKPVPAYDLSAVFSSLSAQNIDIERKRLLVKAARRASTSAMLRYLPTFGVTLGMQKYNHDFAESAKLSVPEETGIFQMGIEQVIYSPALVTNILIKNKQVNFAKAEQFLTEQNMGIDIALMYIETLMLDNLIDVQKAYVKESRENLAIARVREKMGTCGKEEALRWAAQLSINEQHLLDMAAEYKNLKIAINKILNKDQREVYNLAPLKSDDPAFYTRDIHIIDYVITPDALEKFTVMLVDEAFEVAPELAKLRAAIKMKDYEMKMYIQKFVLPDAKLTLDYTSLFGREFTSPTIIPAQDMRVNPPSSPYGNPIVLPPADKTNLRFGMYAQWRPFEGGTKFAEIARVKAEKRELQAYSEEVKHTLEAHIRETINKALAGYFSIDKNHKAMFASQEQYYLVKDMYLKGKAPISQVIDAQKTYLDSKAAAMNSQYVFFKELVWVQRGICAVNWNQATPEAKTFIERVKTNLEKKSDIAL